MSNASHPVPAAGADASGGVGKRSLALGIVLLIAGLTASAGLAVVILRQEKNVASFEEVSPDEIDLGEATGPIVASGALTDFSESGLTSEPPPGEPQSLEQKTKIAWRDETWNRSPGRQAIFERDAIDPKETVMRASDTTAGPVWLLGTIEDVAEDGKENAAPELIVPDLP